MRRPWVARQVPPVLLVCGLFGAWFSSAAAAEALAARPIRSPARGFSASAPNQNDGAVRASLDRIKVLEPGTSERQTLNAAKAAVPLQRLTPENRRRAEAVLDDLSMFRSMPAVALEVDHGSYRYFVEHPDVAVSIWRVLGVSKCQLWQTGPNSYETDVGDGSTGAIDVLLRGEKDHLVLGEGQFKSPLLARPIRAKGLLHLRSEYVTRRDGETEVVCRGTLFVSFPSQTVETAAKVISPVTNMVIDRNFEEIGLFAHMMSLAMRSQPGWIESIAGQMDGILERRRSELLQVTARVYVAQRKRELEREGRPVTAEALAVPIRTGVEPAANPGS